MKLQEWIDAHPGTCVQPANLHVYDATDRTVALYYQRHNTVGLYQLEDYAVSSVCGAVIILVPRALKPPPTRILGCVPITPTPDGPELAKHYRVVLYLLPECFAGHSLAELLRDCQPNGFVGLVPPGDLQAGWVIAVQEPEKE